MIEKSVNAFHNHNKLLELHQLNCPESCQYQIGYYEDLMYEYAILTMKRRLCEYDGSTSVQNKEIKLKNAHITFSEIQLFCKKISQC